MACLKVVPGVFLRIQMIGDPLIKDGDMMTRIMMTRMMMMNILKEETSNKNLGDLLLL
jgi:hypothetical protein